MPKETSSKQSSVFTNQAVQAAAFVALVISAFFLGNLSAKVQYMEKGGVVGQGGTAAPAGKYKTFEDAMKAFGKAVKLDTNKLISCMNSGDKKSIVDADTSYGNDVGVSGTPAFFINGRFIGGAFPYESFKEVIDKELAGTATDEVTDYSQTLQDAAASGSFNPKPVAINLGNAPVQGANGAKVTIVEFSDFQCPFCSRSFPTMEQVLKDYDGKVKLAYKHYPLSFHPRAQITAEASECARDQGKFWEFHDQLFANQTDWSSL